MFAEGNCDIGKRCGLNYYWTLGNTNALPFLHHPVHADDDTRTGHSHLTVRSITLHHIILLNGCFIYEQSLDAAYGRITPTPRYSRNLQRHP